MFLGLRTPLRRHNFSKTAIRSPAQGHEISPAKFSSVLAAFDQVPTPKRGYMFGAGLGFKFDVEPVVTSPSTAENIVSPLSPDRAAVPRLDQGTIPIFNLSSAGSLSPGTAAASAADASAAAATATASASVAACVGVGEDAWARFMAVLEEDCTSPGLSWPMNSSGRSPLLVSA